jgi:hypothetical protein
MTIEFANHAGLCSRILVRVISEVYLSAFAHPRPEMTLLLVEVKPWKKT